MISWGLAASTSRLVVGRLRITEYLTSLGGLILESKQNQIKFFKTLTQVCCIYLCHLKIGKEVLHYRYVMFIEMSMAAISEPKGYESMKKYHTDLLFFPLMNSV